MKLKNSFTVVVFSGEVRSRLSMTAKCINSINDQNYDDLQKILINAGSPPHQTSELIALGVNLDDWTILDFPVDCMDIENNWSIHRWNGAAALHIAEKDFFFALNDDDFISSNFFSIINEAFNEYPSAASAMGLRITYNHETKTYGEKKLPKNLDGHVRPRFEPGINLVRELFFRDNLAYGPSLGFQPVIRTSLIKEIGPEFFYKGFYSDCSPYFQIVCRFDTLFVPEAHMYWGVHGNQDHIKWDLNSYWNCSHEKIFENFMKHNLSVFSEFLPNNKSDRKELKQYFQKRIVSVSLFALTSRYLNKKSRIPRPSYLSKTPKNSFPALNHLLIILKRPRSLTKIIYKTITKK